MYRVGLNPRVWLHVMPGNRQVLLMGDPASRLVSPVPNFPHRGREISAAALYRDTVPASSHPWDGANTRTPGCAS